MSKQVMVVVAMFYVYTSTLGIASRVAEHETAVRIAASLSSRAKALANRIKATSVKVKSQVESAKSTLNAWKAKRASTLEQKQRILAKQKEIKELEVNLKTYKKNQVEVRKYQQELAQKLSTDPSLPNADKIEASLISSQKFLRSMAGDIRESEVALEAAKKERAQLLEELSPKDIMSK